MIRTRLGLFRTVAVIALSAAMLLAWIAYGDAESLHIGFGRRMGNALPIYAVERGYSLSEMPGATERMELAIAVSVAAIALVALSVARRWPTIICVGLALVATFSINVAIARVPAGRDSFVEPFARYGLEYFGDVRLVKDRPLKFIGAYPRLNHRSGNGLSHHAGTHPPGGVLFLWLGEKMFGPAPPPPREPQNAIQRLIFGEQVEIDPEHGLDEACWWAVAVTALAVIPAYVLAQSIGGAAAARRLLPLYVATPNLVLFGATCMDGVFLTFTLSALAAGFVAMRRWSISRPIVAGALLWLASFFTFASIAVPALMVTYALCVGLRRPREAARMLVRAAFVGVVFMAAQWAAQHWLMYDAHATVDAAMRRDFEGLGLTGYESLEIWRNASLGNLLAFTFGSGLAVAALFSLALFSRRVPWRARAFSIAFPLCVLAMAGSTLFSMEVERVWLFLTPAALVAATRAFRGTLVWVVVLALSITQALALEWFFDTYW